MNGINVFTSHRPIHSKIQQTDTDCMDIINIEDSNDCEVFVDEYPERFDDDPNPFACHQQFNKENMRVEIVRMAAEEDEIVKEEYQLNDKYDVVAMDEFCYENSESNENIDYRSSKEIFTEGLLPAENQENVNFLNDQRIGTNRSTNALSINNNNNTLYTNSSTNPISHMEEGAYEIINVADQILKSYNLDAENHEVEADQCLLVLPNADQSSRHASFDSVHDSDLLQGEQMYTEDSSDVDSFVMIDLTLDHEQIDENMTYVIESSENEADQGQHSKEQEQPKKQKRKRKRKCVEASKNRNKRQKSGSKKETKKHECALCHYSTSNKAHFIRHKATHSNKKRFECKICAKRFSKTRTLATHIKLHDRKLNSFQCSTCHREFPREKLWKLHENRCRKGLIIYECHLCKEIVHNKNHLLKHMRLHTGKMNHCPKCRKQFASKLGLTNHMKKHADSFAFQCKTCHQVFSRQDKWEMHESRCKIKEYKCKICNRTFVNTAHLKYHMEKHSGKTFNCSKCSRQFRSAVGYKSHQCDFD